MDKEQKRQWDEQYRKNVRTKHQQMMERIDQLEQRVVELELKVDQQHEMIITLGERLVDMEDGC